MRLQHWAEGEGERKDHTTMRMSTLGLVVFRTEQENAPSRHGHRVDA